MGSESTVHQQEHSHVECPSGERTRLTGVSSTGPSGEERAPPPILTQEQGASRKRKGHSKCQLGSHLDREYTSGRQGTWNPPGEARSTQENTVTTGQESGIGNKVASGALGCSQAFKSFMFFHS